MNKIFHIFKIKREERWIALVILAILAMFNGLVVSRYCQLFTPVSEHYYGTFIKNFHISGFDPLTYYVLSNWETSYNVYRHPLLAFYMYIPYLINQGLMAVTGCNCALFIAVAIQMFCAFYSCIFICRIFREVIQLDKWAAHTLTLFFLSIGYVLVTSIVPDHFVISMMLLILALYISGRRMTNRHPFKIWQSVLYFLLTAGTSLNNGVKIFFSALFVNGKAFFRPKHLLLAVILPAALLWGFCRWEYKMFIWPKEMQKKELKAKKKAEQKKRQQELAIFRHTQDSLRLDSVKQGLITLPEIALAAARSLKPNDSAAAKKAASTRKKKAARKVGHPFMPGEFMGWSDASTSRIPTIVENLFGEGIQLHQDHLLEDELLHRPMIVSYRHWWNYAVEGIICLLFLVGIVMGRKSKYLWLVMSYFALDMLLHIGLGFGITEVYIMTAHWIYAVPIAIAFAVKALKPERRKYLVGGIGAVALYLLVYNGSLIFQYLA